MSRVLTSNSNFRAEFLEVVVVILILTEILVSVFEAHRGVAPMFTISTVTDTASGALDLTPSPAGEGDAITGGDVTPIDTLPAPPLPAGVGIVTSRRVGWSRCAADPTPQPPPR